MNDSHNIEQAIDDNLTVCEIGMALTKGNCASATPLTAKIAWHRLRLGMKLTA